MTGHVEPIVNLARAAAELGGEDTLPDPSDDDVLTYAAERCDEYGWKTPDLARLHYRDRNRVLGSFDRARAEVLKR